MRQVALRYVAAVLVLLALDRVLPRHGGGLPLLLLGIVSAAVIAAGVRQYGPSARFPWHMLAAASFLAPTAVGVQRLTGRSGVDLPLASHLLVIATDVALLAAFTSFVRSRTTILDRGQLLDLGVIAFGAAMAAKIFLVDSTDQARLAGGMPKSVASTYVIVVVAVLVLLVRFAALPGRRGLALWLLLGSQGSSFVASVASNVGWVTPKNIDLPVLICLVTGLVVLSALHPSMVDLTEPGEPSRSLGSIRLAGLGIALVLGAASAVFEDRYEGHVEALWVLVPTAAIAAAVLVRIRMLFEGEQRSREAIAASREAVHALLEGLSDVILVIEDDTGTIQYASDSATSTLALTPRELVGRRWSDLLDADDTAGAYAAASVAAVTGGATQKLRIAVDGDERTFEATLIDRREHPSVQGWIVVLHDVTEREVLESKLRHQSTHDPLTGLANRALLGLRFDEAADREDLVSVLYVDLDDFKAINDAHGHDIGDELLRVVAARLRAAVRADDVVARLGGDEFCILVAGDASVAAEAGERMLRSLQRPVNIRGKHVTVSASIGVASGTGSSDDLLRRADVAMYRAKTNGKAGVAVYDSRTGAPFDPV